MDRSPFGSRTQCAPTKKKVPQRRWFLADPSLIDATGHCGRYLTALSRELARDGIENHLVGNRQATSGAVAGQSVFPFFALTCEDNRLSKADLAFARQPLDQWRRHSASIFDGLEELDSEFGLVDTDVILLNTVRQWSLPGVVEWLETRSDKQCPQIAVILHYTPEPTSDEADPTTAEYRMALTRIARSSRRSHVSLFSDSEELRSEFETLSGLPVWVVPIPHVGDIHRRALRDDEIRIVAAGPARANKGFQRLPAVLTALGKSSRKGYFFVQGFTFQHDPLLARTITTLRRGGATVLPDELSDQEFRELVGTADLIVLPYLAGQYHSQTSGVFAEAIGAGTPVIVPSGTWMARQIATFGGGVVFDGSDDEGIEKACLVAINEIERLTSEAESARKRWLHQHGARQFLTVVAAALEVLDPQPKMGEQNPARSGH